jgi:hypothetical protein
MVKKEHGCIESDRPTNGGKDEKRLFRNPLLCFFAASLSKAAAKNAVMFIIPK